MESYTPPHNDITSDDTIIVEKPSKNKRGKTKQRKRKIESKRSKQSSSHRSRSLIRLRNKGTMSSSSTSSSSSDSSSNKRKKSKSNRRKRRRYSSSASPSPKTRRTQDKMRHSSILGSQNMIPEFNPQAKTQSIKDWLYKINESAVVYGWTEVQTIYFALPRLTGTAKKWYDGLTSVKYTWQQWQDKLLKTFSSEDNYGDLLSEMLSRKSKRYETLEEYYYDKIRLLNRCEITGTKAVDCLIHGIFDHNTRMNIQGSRFSEPEEVLSYFRKISTGNRKEETYTNFGQSREFKKPQQRIQNSNENRFNAYKCFNCGENGHAWMKCPKDLIKCGKCRRIGHTAAQCQSNKVSENIDASKNVLRLQINKDMSQKYFKDVIVNNKQFKAFIDFGSECSLIGDTALDKIEAAQNITETTDLPVLKGFGNKGLKPKARLPVELTVDGVTENIDVFVVSQSLLPNDVDLLLGQNLTELPNIRVLKTDTLLTLFSMPHNRSIKIITQENTNIIGTMSVKVSCCDKGINFIYVSPCPCLKPGSEYLIVPGIYKFEDGCSEVIIMSLLQTTFVLPSGTLIARGKIIPDTMLSAVPSSLYSFESEILNICRLSKEDLQDSEPDFSNINVDIDLDERTKKRLYEILHKNRNCFALSMAELGETSAAEMHIRLKDDTPVTYRPYRLSFSERIKVKEILEDLLQNGIIRESESEYASPIIIVPKKNGELRLCVDYRALNKKTLKDKYPMPLIEDQIDSLSCQVYFSTLDLTSGYHQIPIAEQSKHLTAFITPDGHFEYNRMPFGLCNAPAVFQRMIHKVLNPKKIPGVLTYMDDIIIASQTIEEGMERLERVFDALKEANLTLNLKKCNFFRKKIEFLGYEISSEGIKPGQKKIEAVASFKKPQNAHEIRQFIGLASFFRRFVEGFASIARPLTMLTKSNTKFVWNIEQEQAFSKIKSILVSRPVLVIYNPLFLTELHTDASQIGIGGILLQRPNKETPLRPVAYFSRQTTTEEQHFHSFELETLAVVMSLNRFRVYLLGIEFKIMTDCHAVRQTWAKRDLVPRIARWWLQAQEFNFDIEYRPGAQMLHADALSRNPLVNNQDSSQKDNSLNIFKICINNKIIDNNLESIQFIDPNLYNIKCILDNNCPEAKDIKNKYVLKNGKVYRKIDNELRWAVPHNARWKICHTAHDESGHFSLEKTLDKLKRTYWFPRMNQFVKKYVKACIPCAYAKQTSGRKEGFLHPIPKTPIPFYCIHIDHLGPFTKSKNGNTYILGIIDGYTKFIILKAVRNTKSRTTINLLRDVFGLFGAPKLLISDRGTSFTSAEFEEFARTQEIKHIKNAVATPRANGQIERYNRSILASLTALTNGDEKNWDAHLNTVQWSLNNTLNKGIGKTPSEVIFGKQTISPNESHIHDLMPDPKISNADQISEIRKAVTQHIQEKQNDMTKRFNKTRCSAKTYKENDLVLVQKQVNNPGDSNKLLPRYSGPYRVSKVLENDRYEVSSIEGFSKRKYVNIYAADKMKPWITFSVPDSAEENEQSSSSNSEYSDTEPN